MCSQYSLINEDCIGSRKKDVPPAKPGGPASLSFAGVEISALPLGETLSLG